MKKTKVKNRLFLGILVVFITLAGCNKEKEKNKEKESFINPPIEKMDPEFTEFNVDNQTADTLELESGTKLFIPKNAFADSSGTAVTGNVNVKYREFHDALGIFLAGIPMEFETKGRRRNLQTAGLFEIRAERENSPLQMAKKKSVKVDLASRKAGKEYNFFGFNEETGEWDFMGYSESRENPEYQKTKEKIEKLKNTTKMPLDSTHFIFDYTGVMDVYKYKMDKDPQNQNIKKRVKKYGLEWLKVENDNMINFRGNRYVASFMVWKKLEGRTFPAWLKEEDYFNTEMKNLYGNVYSLEINEDENTYTGKVKCIMPLRSLLAFSPEYWENKYEEAMQKMKEEQERLRTEAKVFRSFEVSEMGVYNFDRLYEAQEPLQVKANFKTGNLSGNENYELNQVFCLPGNDETVISLERENWEGVWLDAEDENFRMVTILPGNELGMVPLEEYRSLNFDSLQKVENPSVDFTIKTKGKEIKSKKQIEDLLQF